MLGRDAHIVSNLSWNFVLQSHMLSTTILKRECICETMKPGPFLIIRNTFPTTFKHLLHSAILKSENTKTLLLLAFTYKNPPKAFHHHCYHSCIIIHHNCIFICCFAFIIIVISFPQLVLDNHLVRLRAQSNLLVCRKSREGQEDKTHTTDSPRVRY